MKFNITIFPVYLLLLASSFTYAQSQNVGINTNNPQQKLHISGVSSVVDSNIGTTDVPLITPTARIDGLNMANNPAVFSGVDTTNPLYVDSNGDSSVKKGVEIFGTYTAPGGDAIVAPTTQNIIANSFYQSTGNLLTVSFTLQQRSQVYISSTLSAQVQTTGGGIITDGKTKAIAGSLIFTAAPASSGITINSAYMSDETLFANRVTASINRPIKLSPSCELVLPAGTYTIVLRGAGACSSTVGEDFRIIWGGDIGDKLNVVSKPL